MRKLSKGPAIGDTEDERNLLMLAAIHKLSNGRQIELTDSDIAAALAMRPALMIQETPQSINLIVTSFEEATAMVAGQAIDDAKGLH